MTSPIMRHNPTQHDGSRTHHENFAATAGVLRLTEHYRLMPPQVKFGSLEPTLIRSRDTQSNDLSIALRFEFRDQDGNEWSDMLDEDEIASLESALKYLLTHHGALIKRAITYTDIDYRSRGGVKVGMYVNPQGASGRRESGEFMSVGGKFVWFHSLKALADVVDEALFKIESLHGSAEIPT